MAFQGIANRRPLLVSAFLLLALGFAIHVAFVLEQRGTAPAAFFRMNPAFDSYRFIADARLIGQQGYPRAAPAMAVHPAYPLAIAAFDAVFGDDSLAFLLFQCLLACASFAVVFWIALALFGPAEALIALAACVLYGPFVVYAAVYLREGMVIFLSLSTVALAIAARRDHRYLPPAGIAAALLMLTRPYPLSVAAVMALLMLEAARRRERKWLIGLAGLLAGYGAVTALMPGPGAAGTDGPLAHFLSGNVLDSSYGYLWLSTPIKERLLAESGGHAAAGVWLLLKEIAAHPWEYILFYVKKLRMLLGDFEIPSNYNFYLFKEELSAVLRVPFLSFGIVAPFAMLGIWRARDRWRERSVLYLWLAVSSFGVFIFPIQDRYRISLVPFFIIFAAYGARCLVDVVRQKDAKRVAAYGAALVAAFYFCRFDYSPLPAPITREDYRNLVAAYHQAGNEEVASFFAKKERLVGAP